MATMGTVGRLQRGGSSVSVGRRRRGVSEEGVSRYSNVAVDDPCSFRRRFRAEVRIVESVEAIRAVFGLVIDNGGGGVGLDATRALLQVAGCWMSELSLDEWS